MNEIQINRLTVITAEIRAYTKSALDTFVEIGRRLKEAKTLVARGEWGDYIGGLGFSATTANNFERLFEEYGAAQIGLAGASVENPLYQGLGLSKAVALLSLDEGERAAFVQGHDVDNMSVKKLQEEIKGLKEEREEAKRAAEEAAEAAERAQALQEEINMLNAEKAALQIRVEALEAEGDDADDDEEADEVDDDDNADDEDGEADEKPDFSAEKAALEKDIAAKEAEIARLQKALDAKPAPKATIIQADEDMARFKVMFAGWQRDFETLAGIAAKHEKRDKLTEALFKALDICGENLRG